MLSPAHHSWLPSTLEAEHMKQGAPCLRVLYLAFKGFQGSLHHTLAAEHDRHDVSPVPDDSPPRARQLPHEEVQEEAFANTCMRNLDLKS